MNYKIAKLQSSKIIDKARFVEHLQERTEIYADQVIDLCKQVYKDYINNVIISQLVRSACSIGSNYIEANESLGRKDFYHKIKICRKEAKESCFWLRRLSRSSPELEHQCLELIQEGREFVLIFSKVITYS